MKDRILIFGNGQLGNFYLDFFKKDGVDAEITRADITNVKEIQNAIDKSKPTVVINSAGKTNLEWCEDNKLETFNINVLGANNIAVECEKRKIYFIHLSSGCIFQSVNEKDEKFEDSEPNPQSYYSVTKVWGEDLLHYRKSENFKYLILRPRQTISTQVNYKNMLVKMLTFSKFIDIPNSVTVVEDLMVWTRDLINQRVTGTVHVANEGWSTPYQIALLIKKYILPDLEFEKITKDDLNKLTPNIRVDTLLNVDRLKKYSKVDPIDKRLEETIRQLGENISKADKKTLKEHMDKTMEQSKKRTVTNCTWESILE